MACSMMVQSVYLFTDMMNIASASIVIVVCTLYIAVRCQIRFGQGLKPYVQWQPLSFWKRDQTSNEHPQHAEEELLGSQPTSPSQNRVSLQAQRQKDISRQRHDSALAPQVTTHGSPSSTRRDTRQVEQIDFTEYFDYLDMIRRSSNNRSNTSPKR